jgi:hypothetical protein
MTPTPRPDRTPSRSRRVAGVVGLALAAAVGVVVFRGCADPGPPAVPTVKARHLPPAPKKP